MHHRNNRKMHSRKYGFLVILVESNGAHVGCDLILSKSRWIVGRAWNIIPQFHSFCQCIFFFFFKVWGLQVQTGTIPFSMCIP